MLREHVTLILGAGSSVVFGLPLGVELKNQIAESIYLYYDDFGRSLERGSHEIAEAFRLIAQKDDRLRGDTNTLIKAARDIADALPMCGSIDDYIERHSGHHEYELCAKLGIAHCILKSERGSALRADPYKSNSPQLSAFEGCWLSEFLQIVTRRSSAKALKEAFSKITVVNFNYDRCFDQFTYFWLIAVYKLSQQEAADILSSIEIIHPYGSIGNIPYIDRSGVIFGDDPSGTELISIAKNIRTYSESAGERDRSTAIAEALTKTKKIIFLGFAFHEQNMSLLASNVREAQPSPRHIFACTYGLSSARWEISRNRLSSTLNTPQEMLFEHLDVRSCEAIFEQYSDNISG